MNLDAGRKHAAAAALLKKLWEEETGVLSTQVIQEFYVNITRKIPRPLTPAQARSFIVNYFSWPVVINGTATIRRASEIQELSRISLWDALIVAAAVEGRADKIVTEDLQAGETIEGIVIVNPFSGS
jgi:predicted nucleic acid-binding protein